MNVGHLVKAKNDRILPSDEQFKNLVQARFNFIDMTDYQYDFSGADERDGAYPMTKLGGMEEFREELWPNYAADDGW